MSGSCTSTHRDLACRLPAHHEGQHQHGIIGWLVSDSTIAEAAAMAEADREAAGRYTIDEMYDDLNDWANASKEQRSEAFSVLLAAVTADAYINQDADLIARLRRIRAKRDAS